MSPRKSRYKPEYHERKKFDMDELRTFLRLSVEEMELVARAFAEKLGSSHGQTVFLFPSKGWSAIDPPNSHMFSEEEDRAFLKAFKESVNPKVVIREIAANLEDDAFAEAVAQACLEIFPSPRRHK